MPNKLHIINFLMIFLINLLEVKQVKSDWASLWNTPNMCKILFNTTGTGGNIFNIYKY